MSGERCKIMLIYLMLTSISVILIGSSIWLHFSHSATLCDKVWVKPLLIVGVGLLCLTVCDLAEFFGPVKFIIWMCMILLSLVIICFMVFSILVTNRKVSRALFGRDGNYSHYMLEKYVVNAEQIKSFLLEYETCQHLSTGKRVDSNKYSLSYAQSSCCKPPTNCGFEFHNATYWTMPKAEPAVVNNDCKIWNNVQTELCFKCQSFKTKFYDIIQNWWKMLSLLSLFILLYCCVLYYLPYLINIWSKGYPRHKVVPAV